MRRVALFVVPATIIVTILGIFSLVSRNRGLAEANAQVAEALVQEQAAAKVAENNYHTAQTAVALAAADATQAAFSGSGEKCATEQQKQSLVAQSTRLYDAQVTQTALYAAFSQGGSAVPELATEDPALLAQRAAEATALVQQLAAVVATQETVRPEG